MGTKLGGQSSPARVGGSTEKEREGRGRERGGIKKSIVGFGTIPRGQVSVAAVVT